MADNRPLREVLDELDARLMEAMARYGERPLTIVCKAPGVEDVTAKGFFLIDCEVARYHGSRIMLHAKPEEHFHPETAAVLHHVTEHGAFPLPSANYEQVMGFIDLTLKLQDQGVTAIQWRHPESGLHPRHQLGLGDVAVYLSKRRGTDDGSDASVPPVR